MRYTEIINNSISKVAFLFVVLFVCTAGPIYAQVTGNQYKFSTKQNVDVKEIISCTVDGVEQVDDNKGTTGNPSGGTYNFVFDNNTSSWWKASSGGDLTIILYFGEHPAIDSMYVYLGQSYYDQPTGITVYQGDDGTTWDTNTCYTAKWERFQSEERIKEFKLDMDIPITKSYVKLEIPGPGQNGAKTQINEITFYHDIESTTDVTIKHKYAKWFDKRGENTYSDNFDKDKRWFTSDDYSYINNYDLAEKQIQASHTYVDTIYMHRGTSMKLTLPDLSQVETVNTVGGYQRWYSFKTDKTLQTLLTGDDEIWDLLTPSENTRTGNEHRVYTGTRFANGYVGSPLETYELMSMNFYMPTKDEFTSMGLTGEDNNLYIVACDVSPYTDYTETYSEASVGCDFISYDAESQQDVVYEPTLSHRILFYIYAVDDMTDGDGYGKLLSTDYQGATSENYADKKYLEEYDITMPAERLNNLTTTADYDCIALSKDANAWAIPGVKSESDDDNIKLIINDGETGITLVNESISGANRVIGFKYPEVVSSTADDYYGGLRVNNINDINPPTATILATKEINGVTYNLARYNITFVKNDMLLTQTIVKKLEADTTTINGKDFSAFSNRTPASLQDNLKRLAVLDFDYPSELADTLNGFYPYPPSWSSSSYGFYDGTHIGDEFITGLSIYNIPEWGEYGITSKYVENVAKNWGTPREATSPSEGSTYHMYIDASDRPGTIAELSFDEQLCSGSELFVSAWVKSASADSTDYGANILLTMMGVKADGTREPLYRYLTGQIKRTDHITNKNDSIFGLGDNTNDWFQLYFSFIAPDVNYASYSLKVENFSYGTKGADMYIDDIRVYVATVSANVTQLSASCDDNVAIVNVKLDWDRLISRTGGDETSDGTAAVDFCFVDKTTFNSTLATLNSDETNTMTSNEKILNALNASVVNIRQGIYEKQILRLKYYLKYDSNKNYDEADDPLIGNEDDETWFYYKTENNSERYLSADLLCSLDVDRPYWLLMKTAGVSDDAAEISDFIDGVFSTDGSFVNCAMQTEFYVEAANIVKIQGEYLDPELTDYCAGQQLDFTVTMRYNTGEKDSEGKTIYKDVTGIVYFDWYFDTSDSYYAENSDYGNVSVYSSLSAFRKEYSTSETLQSAKGEFTEDMYKLLNHLIETNKLVLYKERLGITLVTTGLDLVITPVENPLILGAPENETIYVCWNPISVSIDVTNDAPSLKFGHQTMDYSGLPENTYPNLRIGLSQIEKVVNANNAMTFSLRDPQIVTEGAGYLGDSESDGFDKIYLMGTNDPVMKAYVDSTSSRYSLPVGTLVSLYAKPNNSDLSGNVMKIYFDLTGNEKFKFVPREGYYYEFAVYFEEKDASHNPVENTSCYGTLLVNMLVVPEYLKWNGGTTGNWSNDDNWVRITDLSTINRTTGTDGTDPDYDTQTTNAYVPMQFSKVVIPTGTKVELFKEGYDASLEWHTEKPDEIDSPTDYINYDMLSVEDENGSLSTKLYRTAWIDQIHFESGAQMLHPEYLIYNKAWVDYNLTGNTWHTLSSPLQGVVAGDFYTGKSNRKESGAYFSDITFSSTSNSRLNPAVYQRAWDTKDAFLTKLDGATSTMALTANWSGVYNDLDVSYSPGIGFSLKIPGDAATFRLPKADTSYKYYNADGTESSIDAVTISRTNANKLATDDMFTRVEYDYANSSASELEFSLPTNVGNGDYYLIGNPFMAELNMSEFLAENNDVFEQKYWKSDGVVGIPTSGLTTSETGTIQPLESFFVKKLSSATATTYKFTQDMQMFSSTTSSSAAPALRITATNTAGNSSTALVNYDSNTSYGYVETEDAEMFIDNNVVGMPHLYTVGGDMALSINSLPEINMLPFGIVSDNESECSFVAEGTDNYVEKLYVYDSVTKTYTELNDTETLTIMSNVHGRYFLTTSDGTGIRTDASSANGSVNCYSPQAGLIVASATSADVMNKVMVYGTDGSLVRQVLVDNDISCCINVERGVYIVKVFTNDVTKPVVKKLSVK